MTTWGSRSPYRSELRECARCGAEFKLWLKGFEPLSSTPDLCLACEDETK